jgi:uncharacterized protein (DUF488 family)
MKKISSAAAFTIGHSTRRLEDFVELLRAHSIATLVDVRTMPRSRHNPQFNSDSLAAALAPAAIRYEHAPELGGFRRPNVDSRNTGWRNTSFRGYADYMQTADFERAIAALAQRARSERIALMCAEAVPWRCHRSLIADALTARGIEVGEIVDRARVQPHALTSFAVVEGSRVMYPPLQRELTSLSGHSTGTER